MMTLSVWSWLLGFFFLLAGVFPLVTRPMAVDCYRAFPRNLPTGRVLSVIAWIWAIVAVLQMKLDFLQPFSYVIIGIGLVCIPLTWIWMENLLPCRALGGLLVLLPYELLHVARVHLSPLRLVLVVLAYIMIVWGMTLILYPWKQREVLFWISESPARMRVAAFLQLALAMVLIGLGFVL